MCVRACACVCVRVHVCACVCMCVRVFQEHIHFSQCKHPVIEMTILPRRKSSSNRADCSQWCGPQRTKDSMDQWGSDAMPPPPKVAQELRHGIREEMSQLYMHTALCSVQRIWAQAVQPRAPLSQNTARPQSSYTCKFHRQSAVSTKHTFPTKPARNMPSGFCLFSPQKYERRPVDGCAHVPWLRCDPSHSFSLLSLSKVSGRSIRTGRTNKHVWNQDTGHISPEIMGSLRTVA